MAEKLTQPSGIHPQLETSDEMSTTIVVTKNGEQIAYSEDDKTLSARPSAPEDTTASTASVSTTSAPVPGLIIGQRFVLEKKLGEGGMGTVFLARDLTREKFEDRDPFVAIKLINSDFIQNPDACIALQRETRKAQQLSHPNIVKVYDFGQENNLVYMWMECMQGVPLDTFLHTQASSGMPLQQVLPLVQGMANGLAYIHQAGLVHADFKPNNVFVEDNGEVKILDLGIARICDPGNAERGTTRFDARDLGALTPEYASCEMFEDQDSDPRDDIYALACVTYQLLTGKHPFGRTWSIKARSQNLKPEPVPGLNRRRWRALQQALAFDRKDRTPSAEQFLRALEDKRDSPRNRAVLLGLSALAAGILALVWFTRPDPDEMFLQSLMAKAPATEMNSTAARQVENSIAFGKDLLSFAEESLQSGDIDGVLAADHDLYSGSSNAYNAFTSALNLTPSIDAAQGIATIVSLYSNAAERFQQNGDAATALWLACRGWEIHPNSPTLLKTIGNLMGSNANESGAIASACASTPEPDSD